MGHYELEVLGRRGMDRIERKKGRTEGQTDKRMESGRERHKEGVVCGGVMGFLITWR